MKSKKYDDYKKILVLMKLGATELILLSEMEKDEAIMEAIERADIAIKELSNSQFKVLWSNLINVENYEIVDDKEIIIRELGNYLLDNRVILGWDMTEWIDSLKFNAESFYVLRDEDGNSQLEALRNIPVFKEESALALVLVKFSCINTDDKNDMQVFGSINNLKIVPEERL